MPDWFQSAPGRVYVVATLLPLGAFALLLAAGGLRALCRPFRDAPGFASRVYWFLGGDVPLRAGAYFATGCMVMSAVLAVIGLVNVLAEPSTGPKWAERADWLRLGPLDTAAPDEWRQHRDTGRSAITPKVALALEIGYKIDHLTAVLFAMVTVVGTLIFVFSLGYMSDEAEKVVTDHAVYPGGHPRRGRFGRFFLYLSLFSFSMLNLLIADNLFQVFVSWELVGVCSFFLIGFYYERPGAARAANKAFIVNRVGDAGFLVGILVAWTSLGTLNFEEMARRVRAPDGAAAGTLVRDGDDLTLFPLVAPTGTTARQAGTTYTSAGALPYGLFVLMGAGLFLGCVGKSAQIPLQTWLPDAMEGPTPVSALIHAATMVAAGVYLVGRCFPLFAPEVLLLIAYTGAVTLFVSATIALVQTDIKRVLAYSTCSQLGFMMLALGLGGWVAGLLHLVTHAFFKALLFLCSGSVIHGLHHEQDLRKMGGLRAKMPVTAFTMLIGVLAISGAPLLSGWYSKDLILSASLGYVAVHPVHVLLFALPAVTAGLTAYYMFRLWFLAFTGAPRDRHTHEHAHESPLVMTVPLLVLTVFSVGVAWGWPLWSAEASYLGHVLERAEPTAVKLAFGAEKSQEHARHLVAGAIALVAALAGAAVAFAAFYRRTPSAEQLHTAGPVWYRFLLGKWYFDEAYDAALVKPTVALAHAAAAADKRSSDPQARRFDWRTLDGLLNAVGDAASALGGLLRRAQTGFVRTYVLVLALTAVLMLGMLAVLAN